MRYATAFTAVVFAALLAGCGSASMKTTARDPSTAAKQPAPAPVPQHAKPKPRGSAVRVASTQFGRALLDSHGLALYAFSSDSTGRSTCYGECAKRWPPLLTKGTPVARTGAKGSLLGTTRRHDGTLQVTYNGHPLYLYVSDSPGHILCQAAPEFGGLWNVVAPSGAPIR
jgi:predicted lipoprotein with Yx(FWY)xxD motif